MPVRRWSLALNVAGLAGVLLGPSGCLLLSLIDSGSSNPAPTEQPAADAAPIVPPKDAAPKDGATALGPARVVARTAPGLRGVGIDAARVYFANEDTGEVRFAPKAGDGAAGSTFLASAKKPTDIVVDATRVYWIQDVRAQTSDLSGSFPFRSIAKDGTDLLDGGRNYLTSVRMTMAGGQVVTSSLDASGQWSLRRDGTLLVQTGAAAPIRCVVSDGVTVYYELGGALRTYPERDGTVPFATADATDLAVDGASVYWITSSGAVQKLDKQRPGEKPIDLATGLSSSSRIAVDEQNVYVTAWGTGTATGRVIRIPKAGGPAIDVATSLNQPWGVAVDASGVYVTNHGDGTVIVLPRL
jgi:hypothetical protein